MAKKLSKVSATRRLNLQVSDDAAERLLIHAIKARVSPGELVTTLIETHLRQYRVQANHAARAMSEVSAEIPDHVSESAGALAIAG